MLRRQFVMMRICDRLLEMQLAKAVARFHQASEASAEQFEYDRKLAKTLPFPLSQPPLGSSKR